MFIGPLPLAAIDTCTATCDILPLRIKTGRYEGKAEAESLCEFCDNNSVAPEAHFLFQCTQCFPYRDRLIKDVSTLHIFFQYS